MASTVGQLALALELIAEPVEPAPVQRAGVLSGHGGVAGHQAQRTEGGGELHGSAPDPPGSGRP